MKSFSKFGMLTLAFLVLFGVIARLEVKAQDAQKISALLTLMDTHRQQLKSLKAGISFTKHDSQVGDDTVRNGTVMYVPGTNTTNFLARINWQSPEESLAIAKGQYAAYKPSQNVMYVGDASKKTQEAKSASWLSYLKMSKEELKNNFTVKWLGEEKLSDGVPVWHLKLIPKKDEGYKYGEVWVDGNGMPIQFKVVEKNDDYSVYRLSNLEKNVKMSADYFKIKVGKEVKIVKT
jgi:outer membrane lipoprotein-sorting protein